MSIAWKEFASPASNPDAASSLYPAKRSFLVKSSKFGGSSSTVFTPEEIYDPARLDLVNVSTPYDIVLFSPSSLKNLSSFHRIISSNLILPNHTILLVESTGYVGLHEMIASKFPHNPVCAISSEVQVRMIPPSDQGYVFNGQEPLPLLLHTGAATRTVTSPPGPQFADPAFSHRLKSFSLALQTAGVDASVSSSYDEFQWHQVIPFVAFQPLSVILEAASRQVLVNNVLSKPLFSGIISELMELARKQSGCEFPPDYLNTTISKFLDSASTSQSLPKDPNFVISPSPQSSSSSSSSLTYSNTNPAYLDSPLLFYNYFHSLPIYPDLLLLQPILLADDHGIKTPYLESVFAFLSQLISFNSASNNSVFLSRNHEKKRNNQPEIQYIAKPDENLAERLRSLDLREKAQKDRSRQLDSRQLKLEQWSSSLQRLSQQQPQQQGPVPPQHAQGAPNFPPRSSYTPGYGGGSNTMSTYGGPPGYGRQRPMSAQPTMTMTRGPPPPVENPELIDMMAMTSRKNRRSVGGPSSGGRMRNSASSVSLAQMNGPGSRANSISQYGNPRAGRGSVSQAMIAEGTGFELDGLGSLTSDRYGAVDSSTLSKSRTNSMTASSLMRGGAGPYSHSNSSPALFRDHFAPHLNGNDGSAYPRHSSTTAYEGSGFAGNGGYPRPGPPSQRTSFNTGAPRGPSRPASPPQASMFDPGRQQAHPPLPPHGDAVDGPVGDAYGQQLYADNSEFASNPYANGR